MLPYNVQFLFVMTLREAKASNWIILDRFLLKLTFVFDFDTKRACHIGH